MQIPRNTKGGKMMEYGEPKEPPKIEQSLKYLSNYFKFNLKEDLTAVFEPLISSIKLAIEEMKNGRR